SPEIYPLSLHDALPIFELCALAAAQLEHRAPRPRIRGDHDLGLGRIGQHGARRLTRHFAAMDFVCDPSISLHQLCDETHVRGLRSEEHTSELQSLTNLV